MHRKVAKTSISIVQAKADMFWGVQSLAIGVNPRAMLPAPCTGKVEGAGFQVVAKGPIFTANLSLTTRGDKQSVTIRSQDAQAEVQGATINMQRG